MISQLEAVARDVKNCWFGHFRQFSVKLRQYCSFIKDSLLYRDESERFQYSRKNPKHFSHVPKACTECRWGF